MYDEAISRETFTHHGRQFEMAIFSDYDAGAPWENSDGHGPVRFISDREPLQSGETVLCDMPRGRYVYDLRAAIQQSMRDGWGRPNKATRERLAHKLRKPACKVSAIDADMDYLRGWCSEDWCYVGVSVRIIGPDGEPQGGDYQNAIWGVESQGNYPAELARELADEILHGRRKVWLAALREARARKYWACRDVETVGA